MAVKLTRAKAAEVFHARLNKPVGGMVTKGYHQICPLEFVIRSQVTNDVDVAVYHGEMRVGGTARSLPLWAERFMERVDLLRWDITGREALAILEETSGKNLSGNSE